ncbi:HEAT repeat domain-containing protein [Dapis sp. BLCC M229]|uniref:HEAT repeat domain-containing protein n=1 Tax=Dapis sp. BLCC M229 TaxID=3400188 RepID=UPI003CED75FF
MKFKLLALTITLINITLVVGWIEEGKPTKNLTPLPPFPAREGGSQSLSPRRREVWREVFVSLQTVSHNEISQTDINNYIEQIKNNPNWQVRSQAAKALGKFNQHPDTVIPVLIAALEDTDEVVRLRATFSLIEIGLPAAPQLIDALETENDSALASAKFALRYMGMSVAPTLSNALSSSERQVRSSTASIFQEMAADIERRPISKAPSLEELKQAVSYLEEALRDMESFIKLHYNNELLPRDALWESVGGYEQEDMEAIRKSMVGFKSEIRSHYARNFRRGFFLSLSSLVLAGGLLFWYRPELFLRWSRSRLRAKQNREVTDRLKIDVQKFLQKAGAKTSNNGKHGLQITSATGKLKPYIPIPVSLAIEQPDAQDVVELVQQATKMKKSNQQQAGIILYREPPDTLFRMRMAEVRLRDRFILIPIPLTAVEKALREEKESSGLLADYTERYLPGADLFDDRNAIGDTLTFFGRGELLQRLEENLRRGQGIGIFGLRKSGKTSLLLQLGFAMRENPLVHIDLQSYGGKPRYGAELFNQILSKLSQLIESRSPKIVSRPKLFESDRPAAHLTTEFTQHLQNLTQQLTEVGYQLPILIFLDEIERIIPTETDAKERAEECNAFFGALRAVSQEKRSLSLLVADVHPDINRINQWKQPNVPTNPVFNFFKEIFVVPFSADETTRMLTDIGNLMGITFDAATQSEIHIRSGGHPFVSRQLASLLCKKVAKEHEGNIHFADAERYLSKPFTYSGVLKDYCGQNIWGDIEKREFQSAMAIMRLLACNEKLESGIPSSVILKKLENKLTESECLDALLWLESVGLILRQELGAEDIYQIKLPLLTQWLRMQMKQQEAQEWQLS